MSMQILALIVVVLAFTALFVWVFLPSNRARFEAHGELILDEQEHKDREQRGEQS